MTTLTKNILEEIKDIPDEFAIEILDFIRFKKFQKKSDKTLTHVASEIVLAEDWLKPEEDEAWKDL